MDTGPDAIQSAGELDRVRRQARQVRLKAFALAAALTLLSLLGPAF